MIKKNIKMFVIIINRKNENLYIKNILIMDIFKNFLNIFFLIILLDGYF